MINNIKNTEDLLYQKKNVYKNSSKEDVFSFSENYKSYLNITKTEREAVKVTVEMAKKYGFTEYTLGDKIITGDKKYFVNKNKQLILFIKGKEKAPVKILVSHVDSPRLDLKQNPLYEDENLSFFKTHYYGGIKKYQWTTVPLALHGVVYLEDGTVVELNIGENDNDPIFYITDLLPHLSREQNEKTLKNGISADNLNVFVGSIALDGDYKNAVKLNVLKILNEKYGITEEDFLSAELCFVPALKARDIGFDRSLIGAYGHDDKVCSYPAIMSTFEYSGDNTVITILADKEEIGSEGNTGMQSGVFVDILNKIAESDEIDPAILRYNAECLSADVTSAYDPNYSSVYEKNNSGIISCGVAMSKYTGSGGKSSSNDASAEYVAKIRKIFKENNVVWQTAELGKTDAGGGGTVAKYVARLNIDTVDLGVPVLSMHAPYEAISKADVYSCYLAFKAFIK